MYPASRLASQPATEALKQDSIYTEAFTLYTEVSTQSALHTEAFAQSSFYTQKLLHTEAFT